MKEILIKSSKEMQDFAQDFAMSLRGGEVITLSGDLGFGKTTFVQGLAKGLGVTSRIISPTFVLIRTYEASLERMFYHVDLYRLEHTQEIDSLGLTEMINNPRSIVAVEWPERLDVHSLGKRIAIQFHYIDDTTRRLIIDEIN